MTGRWPRRRAPGGPHAVARARRWHPAWDAREGAAPEAGDGAPACPVVTSSATGGRQVVTLRLEHLSELFDLPETDLLSEDRDNFYLTGMDFALSEIRGRAHGRGPLSLDIRVPAAEVTPGSQQAVARAIRRYCEARIHYNLAQRRAALADGLTSLKVGLPVAVTGIIVAAVFRTGLPAEVIGAVLTWVGLWYPLDQMLFYPAESTRENRPLRRLRDARVALRADG
jgi:hypothetical protein